MKIEEVKENLLKNVMYNGTEYILNACILRRNNDEFYYRVEIKSLNCNSVIICRLEDVEVADYGS